MSKVVICRCEDVLLSDITEAIEGGNHDVESLKRFTGFGTGVCQGKSCVAHVGAVLAEQLAHLDAALPIRPFTPRPPVSPIPLRLLATTEDAPELVLRGPRSRR
jgi:sarcosine oxidase subunit beta